MSYFLLKLTSNFLFSFLAGALVRVQQGEVLERQSFGIENSFGADLFLTLHLVKMFRTSKKNNIFWASVVHRNQYPAHVIHNYSLAKTSSALSIWTPLHVGKDNVEFVYKEDPKKSVGGEDFALCPTTFKDIKGKGESTNSLEDALHHPIKV